MKIYEERRKELSGLEFNDLFEAHLLEKHKRGCTFIMAWSALVSLLMLDWVSFSVSSYDFAFLDCWLYYQFC